MADVASELYDLLSYALLGHGYDSDSTQREKFLIDHLVEEVRKWELGTNTTAELKAIFDQHDLGNFDLLQWIQSKADEGEYDLSDDEEE